MLQLPAAVPSRRPASLSGLGMASARTVWFSLYLVCHRSAALVSALNVSPLTQTIAPMWGSEACFSSPTPGPVLLTLLFLPLVPSLLSFTRFYTFFSAGQALLSTLSWCSACTSVSEGVFLMYPWREMSSTSTNSSTILFSKTQIVIFQHCLVEHFCYFSKVSFLRETFLNSSTNICSLCDITSPLTVLT